ncbi:hypothetical protein KY284_020189 [Solanum tuberosum]|nr:hypothetical protein KY284_020189 [Solanum tuberosum]
MGQWVSQVGLAKWLGDPPNRFSENPAHWLLLGRLAVTFGGLGFKGRCAECPRCSPNGQPFSAAHWISRRSWNPRQRGSFYSFFDDLKATTLFTKELGLRAMSYNTYARRKNSLMGGYTKKGESLACLVCLEPSCLNLPFKVAGTSPNGAILSFAPPWLVRPPTLQAIIHIGCCSAGSSFKAHFPSPRTSILQNDPSIC